ncbi:MAG: adenylate/guanylate cyclase domain-containing protein [Mariprofundaceae bacterium]
MNRRDLIISLGILTMSVVFLFWNPPVVRHLESTVLDWHFQLRGELLPQQRPVTLVLIDDASLDSLGRWPWPRATMAELIRALGESYAARVIVTDIVFSEPEVSPLAVAGNWMQENGVQLPQSLLQRMHVLDGDRQLARAIRESPARVVQGFYYYSSSESLPESPDVMQQRFERVADNALYRVLDKAAAANATIEVQGLNTNIPLLAEASRYAGFLNFLPDVDGALRFSPLLARQQGIYLPSLSLAAASAWLGDAPISAEVGADAVHVQLAGRDIEATAQGLVWINYYGPQGTVPTVSAVDVLQGKASPALLKDRLVLIGVSAAGAEDVRTTPVDALMPGSEIQAQMIENLLNHDFLTRPDAVYLFEILLVLIIGVFYGLFFGRVIERTHGLLSVLFMVVIAALAHGLFRQGMWMHIVVIEMQLVCTMMVLFALHYGQELLHRRKLRHAFASFVDPAVVDQVVAHEDEVGLSGDEREISVMFLDVAGFTALSERLPPADVVHHINSFFDAASPIVFRYGGCIDRLTGDGLIALFGAPIACDDHATRACRAALELEQALDPIRPAFEALEHPLHVRCGVNSGRLIVGNMGSTQRLQYTFMGDAGNAAARLESLNKQYGSTRMIGEATYARLDGEFVCRMLDRVVLVGKQEAMTVYELLGERADAARWQPLIEAYGAAFELYRKGDFAAAAKAFEQVFRKFHDAPAQRMWQRSVELDMRKAPPEDWQGIWKASSK